MACLLIIAGCTPKAVTHQFSALNKEIRDLKNLGTGDPSVTPKSTPVKRKTPTKPKSNKKAKIQEESDGDDDVAKNNSGKDEASDEDEG